MNLSNATNASISDSQGVGTIADNDVSSSSGIDNATATEGNSGTINATPISQATSNLEPSAAAGGCSLLPH